MRFISIVLTIVLSSCVKQEIIVPSNEESPLACTGTKCVGIRIINNTTEDIELIKFGYWNDNKSNPIEFTNIAAGNSSNYQYVENLFYSFHNLASGIYLGNQFEAKLNGFTENYFYKYGLCGNGLTTEEVNEAHFDITLENIDPAKKTFFAKQVRID